MASSIQLLRSTIAQERPFPGNLLEGQPAVNLNASEPGLFFKAADGSLVKIGPAAITSDGSPPNSSYQGSLGNTIGELWLDKSTDPAVLKVYDGAQWVDAGSGGGSGPGVVTLQRWIKMATGGETTLSGADDAGQILSFTPGLEEVFINGVLLTRGTDYSTTSGSSISLSSQIALGDEVTVLGWSPFTGLGPIDGTNLIDGSVFNEKISPNAAIESSKLSFTQSGTGASTRTVSEKLKEAVSVKDFGAVGDGSFDDTSSIQNAINYAVSNGYDLILEGTYAIDTFSTTLDDGILCALKIGGSLRIKGNGTLTSSISSVSRAILGIDGSSGSATISIQDINFAGANRFRAIHSSSNSLLSTLIIDGVTTARQSIFLIGGVSKGIWVKNNVLGSEVISSTPSSPTLNVTLPYALSGTQNFLVTNNVVRTGSEVISSGAFVIHGIPVGGECSGNTHYNLGLVANEGYDIDNVGRFAKICKNVTWGSGFEYKTGTQGYSDSRDILFSENISYSSVGVGFTVQSSCMGFGNIAYNPASWGLFLTPSTDVDNLLDKAHIYLNGLRIIYAGSSWPGAVRLSTGSSQGYKSLTIENLRVELDPEWNADNPGLSIPGNVINIAGNASNLYFKSVYIDRINSNGVVFRPQTISTNITFENFQWGGDVGDSCFDLADCQDVRILNPDFPSVVVDMPVRLSNCSKVAIISKYRSGLSLAQTSGSNSGVLINNYGTENAGIGNRPSVTDIWPIGSIVKNTADGTVWIRVSDSGVSTTDWNSIA